MNKIRNKKGFTLVELIVVMAIIAILFAVMIPSVTIYIKKQNEAKDRVQAEAYSILIQTNFSDENIYKSNARFDLDEVLNLLIKRNYSLTPQSSLRFIYNFEKNEIKGISSSKVTPYEGEEKVLFPKTWQANSMTVIEKYGYFATFPMVEYKIEEKTYLGYDVTLNKKANIAYKDGLTEAGAYDQDNKLIASWTQLVEEGKADEGSGINNNLNLPENTKKFIFPNTLKRIANGLRNNSSIEYIFVPDTIEEITNGFTSNVNLKLLRLPASSSTTYGSGFSFSGNTSMEYINLPNEMKSIGNGAFQGSGVKNLILPDGIETLANKPFEGADKLEGLALSRKFKRIDGDDTFKGCINLRELFIGKSIKYVSTTAFIHGAEKHVPNLEKLYFEGVLRRWLGEGVADKNNLVNAFPTDAFTSTSICCYSPTDPKELAFESSHVEYRYWHFVGYQMALWK